MYRFYVVVISLIFLLPSVGLGLEQLTDDQLKESTATSGVQIMVDDVVLEFSDQVVKFIDSDGLGEDDVAGAITIKREHSMVSINAIVDADPNSPLQGKEAPKFPYMHALLDAQPATPQFNGITLKAAAK